MAIGPVLPTGMTPLQAAPLRLAPGFGHGGHEANSDRFESHPATPPSAPSLPSRLALKAIDGYRFITRRTPVKHVWGNMVSCHFYTNDFDSCSEYGKKAFETEPFLKAMGLTTARIVACNPFNRLSNDTPLKQRVSGPKRAEA